MKPCFIILVSLWSPAAVRAEEETEAEAAEITAAEKTASETVVITGIGKYSGTINRKFRITPVGKYYKIINVASGKALDVKGGKARNKRNIQLYKSNGSAAQSRAVRPAS